MKPAEINIIEKTIIGLRPILSESFPAIGAVKPETIDIDNPIFN